MTPARPWLLDAAELLAEADPGPTPYLVDGLIVERALVACVGRWKTTKSYALLHICAAVATGRKAFGALDVPVPGPVIFANEESGRAALWRRLDALARGSAIDPEELRGQLMVGANAGIRLDDRGWQEELVAIGKELKPRLFALDPLARMKAPALDENEQKHMAALIEFLRHLREETDSTVSFVHHTGHAGGHMRGSSDLESVWESRLTWNRDGQSSLVTLESEHREAEAGTPIQYRIAWDGLTRSMRFDLVADRTPDLAERILEHLREQGPGTTDDVRRGVGVRKSDVQRTLEMLEEAGTTHRGPSGRRDQLGRPIRDKVWNLSDQHALWPVPANGNSHEEPATTQRGSVGGPVPIGDGPHGRATGPAKPVERDA